MTPPDDCPVLSAGGKNGVMRRRRIVGSTFLILMIGIMVLSILGMSLSFIMQNRGLQVQRRGRSLVAESLAESGVHEALFRLRRLFRQELVTPRKPGPDKIQRVNEELLDLLDAERARDWARRFTIKDRKLARGGTITVFMEVLNVSRINLGTYIDRVEVIPRSLEQYRERKKMAGEEEEDTFGMMPLGGWVGKLRIVSEGCYRNTRRVIEMYKDIKVLDVTPPAPDHTLFIEGEGNEEIKEGRFILSNLNLPLQVRDLIFELGQKVNEVLRLNMSEDQSKTVENIDKIMKLLTSETDEADMTEALKLIHEMSKHASDEKIKDMVDNIILSLDPRDWGRVRTNGVLYVYMPFFAADDIINYFADSSYFGHQRPEVGYLFCQNRLHDPYLSVYTHYEGYIYKHYQRLNPLILGPSTKPQPVPPQRYTINTRPDYVRRYPDRKAMPNLARLSTEAKLHAHRVVKRKISIYGSGRNPINLSGLWYFTEPVSIGGYYSGRGMIVSEKVISVTDSLVRTDKGDSLSLVALKQYIELKPKSPNYFRLHCGLYAKEGLRGTRDMDVQVFGNLAVNKLNRAQMPKFFTCRFDSDLKNHMADNVVGIWGRVPLVRRELGAHAELTMRKAGVEPKLFR